MMTIFFLFSHNTRLQKRITKPLNKPLFFLPPRTFPIFLFFRFPFLFGLLSLFFLFSLFWSAAAPVRAASFFPSSAASPSLSSFCLFLALPLALGAAKPKGLSPDFHIAMHRISVPIPRDRMRDKNMSPAPYPESAVQF